jgi:predicted nucleic acid-binding protein
MAINFTTVYWDACVFHALLGSEPGRVKGCLQLEKQARQGALIIYTSAITLTECVWLKGKERIAKDHEAAIQKYFQHKFIRLINCDRIIAEHARMLVWQYNIPPRDSIHVASAISQQVDVMHSYDNADIVKFDGKIGNPALKIENPPEPAIISTSPPLPDPRRIITLEG